MRFTKMHGAGNDYIYVNCFEERLDEARLPEIAVRVSDRRFGVGSDGLVLISPSETADFKMRIFNADGSEAKMCGNATRCVAKYVFEHGLTNKNPVAIETLGGIKTVTMRIDGGKVLAARVDMGAPVFEEPAEQKILLADGTAYDTVCVSMGNPHCVTFVEDVQCYPVAEKGPLFERHPRFPDRVNAEFVQVIDQNTLRMRVWERGSGETLACGTGACAAAAAAVFTGDCQKDTNITIHLPGGDLVIRWDSVKNTIFKTGPAAEICTGTFFLEES
ncbi:MAG: diaminopimelate epimerase [Oscillospiraceae bacterium]|jgi:diaminopimelate epimerase|nr:diaminopimelate epimerase [Oscillospiraceae bacterium]